MPRVAAAGLVEATMWNPIVTRISACLANYAG